MQRAITSAVLALIAGAPLAQDWPVHGADQAGTRYSPLAQIDRGNVAELRLAWTYRTGEMERRGAAFARSKDQNVPIIAAGALIVCTPFNRVIALDPATGSERWVFDPEVTANLEAPASYGCRGVAQWRDEAAAAGTPCRHRLIFGTNDLRIFAIDAESGRRCADFGAGGGVRTVPDREPAYRGESQYLMPPAVIGDVAVFGSSSPDYRRANGPAGTVRAFDVRSGAQLWQFEPIPRDPADPAWSTWQGGSAARSGGGNVWGNMAVDEPRDLVFLPTANAAADSYGGHRPGANRYTSSLLALRATTGERVWHFQIVHHDLWGWDVAPQPLLVDLTLGGRKVPAVVQNTKQGLVFVLDRETGEPLFPVEERPVPAGDVPGEWYSPTQPFPVRPPPLIKPGLGPKDAWGFTFWDRNRCRERIAALDHGSLYTPPSLRGTLMYPWSGGGPNWGGPAYDPARGVMVVNASRIPAAVRLVPIEQVDPAHAHYSPTATSLSPMAGTPYAVEKHFVLSPFGAPCSAPPWGVLAAVDLASGTIKWEVALGSLERFLPVPLPLEWGVPNIGAPIVTGGGLVFIAATFDQKFRAFDIDTGERLWQAKLPAGAQTTPITYLAGGRQFVVLTAGGHAEVPGDRGDHVLAYALP
jgi:quinoprotein glucose dehydrogenase